MQVHRLELWEVERLRAIRLEALRDSPEAFCTTLAQAEAWDDSRWTEQLKQLPTFVAAKASVSGLERDVGMVRIVRHETRPDTAVLISMWVDAASRGDGVADALLDATIVWARDSGCARVLLSVAEDNVRARAFYVRRGFKPTGVVETMPPPRDTIQIDELELVLPPAT